MSSYTSPTFLEYEINFKFKLTCRLQLHGQIEGGLTFSAFDTPLPGIRSVPQGVIVHFGHRRRPGVRELLLETPRRRRRTVHPVPRHERTDRVPPLARRLFRGKVIVSGRLLRDEHLVARVLLLGGGQRRVHHVVVPGVLQGVAPNGGRVSGRYVGREVRQSGLAHYQQLLVGVRRIRADRSHQVSHLGAAVGAVPGRRQLPGQRAIRRAADAVRVPVTFSAFAEVLVGRAGFIGHRKV